VLADTGLVSAAAAAVGMARETAYRLRRSSISSPSSARAKLRPIRERHGHCDLW
jgi:hypothetical protein